jgi:hypothetical protein
MPDFVKKVNASPSAEVVLITCEKPGYFEPILAENMHDCQGGGSDNGTLSAAKNWSGPGRRRRDLGWGLYIIVSGGRYIQPLKFLLRTE